MTTNHCEVSSTDLLRRINSATATSTIGGGMRFRSTWTISNIAIDKRQAPLEFHYLNGEAKIDVTIRRASDVEIADGAREDSGVAVSVYLVTAPLPILRMIRSLARGKLPKGSHHRDKEFRKAYGEELVDRAGNLKAYDLESGRIFWNPPQSILPETLVDFIDDASSTSYDFTLRTLRTLEWRLGRRSPRTRVSSRDPEWSLDGRRWRNRPRSYGVAWVDSFAHLRAHGDLLTDVSNIVQDGQTAPLGFTLLVDAWAIGSGDARSAYLLGATAVEIGIKQFIAEVEPAAEWLAVNSPTPPIRRILSEFIPELIGRLETEVELSDQLIERIARGYGRRNDFLHNPSSHRQRGESPRDFLEAVTELLDTLDAARGFEWAGR